ncbi:MAG: hypothetical protein O9287_07395 [Microcystis sp. LE17-20D]|uniref:hypothetical protein n=1 Tax=Microcystis sp. TaxID=1127 RepID=UPI0022BD2BA3|nr:hypothetical protein [Microcystis sp. LE17-20D]MCZ8065757.1 hypothetical protein [Microcystis sp. LE17-20D]MCZ8162078.1 hypothetical protein [Microcystis sp. LE19-196.1B]MCZ8275456.1 hypothetical protein [Microcystis sp. LE19-4.1E]
MDHNCDACDSKIEDIPEFIRQNLIVVTYNIWTDSCKAIKELKDNDYNKHLILIITDLEEEILENREKFSKNQFARNYFTTQIKQYLEDPKKSAGEPSAKSLWAKPISTQLKFILEALNSASDSKKFELKDILYFVEIIQREIISVESLEGLLNLLITEILKEEMNREELKFIVNTIIIMFIERGYHVKTLENLLPKQLSLFQDHWNLISTSKYRLYLYRALIYESPKYNEEVYSEDEDYKIALKQYYDSLGLKDRIFLMKKIYVEPPKKYKVIFKLSNFALANYQSLNIGNVYFYIPKIHGKITKSIFRDDTYIDESSDLVQFEKRIQEFEVMSESIYYVAVDIEGNDFYSMKDQAIRTVERAVSVFFRKDTLMKKTNNNEIQINNYIICDDLGEGAFFEHSYISNEEFDIPNNIYTDRIGPWLSSKNSLNKSVETWLTAIELYRKSVESVQSSDALLYSWYSLEHFINKSEKITVRLPKEKEFDKSVFGEWYNADNISVLQLLLAIVTIKSKFFDDFGQKNSQIDHTTCLNKIKQAIIDVKNDVYNIYRIRNMLVHSSNTKSKLLEDYSKRNKEYSLRLILEIRKHLFATESDTEIQPINTYFTRMIIDANVAFEAVVNNDMDKFRKWIIQ